MGRLFNESAFFVFDLLLGWRWHERRFKIIMKSGVSFALVRILRVSNIYKPLAINKVLHTQSLGSA